jgi:hypothetical protein
MNPRYPIYIVSKGRADTRLTSKALESLNVPYYIIVEEEELGAYVSVIDRAKILTLPKMFHQEYDPCDEHGMTKPLGPGPARNYAWYHSIRCGFHRHWVMDDNIASFNRLNRNLMVKVTDGAIFAASEDFVDRYHNIAIAGFNYDFFAKAKEPLPAFVLNTRIYSCLLIKNNIPYRWRGRYNEDTDLSLRALKSSYVTCQFNAFLQEKATTQTLKGGNTDAFYAHEGTGPKSEMLARLHPDVARVTWRFNRQHHHVDYSKFKRNALVRTADYNVRPGPNNYGMHLIPIK